MARQPTPPPNRFRALLHRALAHAAALKIVAGVLTVSAIIWVYCCHYFVHHQLTIQLISHHGRKIAGIPVTLINEADQDSITQLTDGKGVCIFSGRHRVVQWRSSLLGEFANQRFPLNNDTLITYVVDKPEPPRIPVISNVHIPEQPHRDPEQATCKILSAVKIIDLDDRLRNADTMQTGGDDKQEPSANDILSKLSLAVRIDPTDHYRNHKDLIAYHYYLSGERAALDHVRLALYQRNASNFPETKAGRFIICDRRSNGFEYIGYQSGDIYTVYVQIQLANGERSAIMQKEIFYPVTTPAL